MPDTSLPSISDIRGWARIRSSSSNRNATPEAVSFSLFNTSWVASINMSPAITPPCPVSAGLHGVALLSGGEKNVWPGQPAAIAALGVLVPGALARIVVERPRQFPDRFELSERNSLLDLTWQIDLEIMTIRKAACSGASSFGRESRPLPPMLSISMNEPSS